MVFDYYRRFLTDPFVLGTLALIAAVAGVLAVVFAFQQLRAQSRRWEKEDARVTPAVFVALSGGPPSKEGWHHGVWQVTNQAPFDIDIVKIEVIRPRELLIGALNPKTDGAVETMKVAESGTLLQINEKIPAAGAGKEKSLLSKNFLYRLGRSSSRQLSEPLRLRFVFKESNSHSGFLHTDYEAIFPK